MSITDPPAQMEGLFTVTLGSGLTVMVPVAAFMQEFVFVPTTV